MGQEPYTVSILFAEADGTLRLQQSSHRCNGRREHRPFAQVIAAGLYPKDELSRLPEGILENTSKPMANRDTFAWSTRSASGVVFQCHDLLCFKEIGHDYSLVVLIEHVGMDNRP